MMVIVFFITVFKIVHGILHIIYCDDNVMKLNSGISTDSCNSRYCRQ